MVKEFSFEIRELKNVYMALAVYGIPVNGLTGNGNPATTK